MKQKPLNKNYLDNIPVRSISDWNCDENGIVTLSIENKGIFNRIAQVLLRKPRISYIHLDEHGSFVWTIIDGERSVAELADDVEAKFGEAAHPLYERLAKYIQILESYGFISFKGKN